MNYPRQKTKQSRGNEKSSPGGGRKPTHLQRLILAPQEHLRRIAPSSPSIPSSKNGLLECRVHYVLYAPNVVANAVRRELLSHYACMRPRAGARTRDDAVCCGEEVPVPSRC